MLGIHHFAALVAIACFFSSAVRYAKQEPKSCQRVFGAKSCRCLKKENPNACALFCPLPVWHRRKAWQPWTLFEVPWAINESSPWIFMDTDILSDLVSDLSFRQVSRNQLITADVADHRPATAAGHFLWHQVDRRSRSQDGTSNFSNALPVWTAHSNWPLGSAVLIALRASPVLVTSAFYGDQWSSCSIRFRKRAGFGQSGPWRDLAEEKPLLLAALSFQNQWKTRPKEPELRPARKRADYFASPQTISLNPCE